MRPLFFNRVQQGFGVAGSIATSNHLHPGGRVPIADPRAGSVPAA